MLPRRQLPKRSRRRGRRQGQEPVRTVPGVSCRNATAAIKRRVGRHGRQSCLKSDHRRSPPLRQPRLRSGNVRTTGQHSTMARLIIAAILLLPLAEIVTFVAVATLTGVGTAFLLMLATSLLGFLLLRRAGRSGLAHLRTAMDGIEVKEGRQRGPEHLLRIV